jgi:hypothetical protein
MASPAVPPMQSSNIPVASPDVCNCGACTVPWSVYVNCVETFLAAEDSIRQAEAKRRYEERKDREASEAARLACVTEELYENRMYVKIAKRKLRTLEAQVLPCRCGAMRFRNRATCGRANCKVYASLGKERKNKTARK